MALIPAATPPSLGMQRGLLWLPFTRDEPFDEFWRGIDGSGSLSSFAEDGGRP